MPPKKKQTAGYEMAEFIKPGTTIKDVFKKEWVVGDPVGQGGFGMIYLCDQKGSPNDLDSARYVIKIEPKKNGPLFTEINYYQRNCKEVEIDKFSKRHKLKVLGIPKYIVAGIHEYNKKDLRYLIMPRFGRDLQKVFEENGKKFSRELIAQIAIKMLYAIEYMHGRRYAHADIKGANILLGNEVRTGEKEELFLIDFGLAYLVPQNVKHQPDPRCKHDGTIEYCSTDAHDGSKPSFRGDIEILSWCLSHWASGELPWESVVKANMTEADKEKVANQKRAAASNPKKFLNGLGIGSYKEIESLLAHSAKLDYGDNVDFEKCRSFFKSHLPKGNKLAIDKVKSRKSFVKLTRPSIVVSRDVPLSTPKRGIVTKAPKSTKRRLQKNESSSDENIQPRKSSRSSNSDDEIEISKPRGRTSRTPSTKSTPSNSKSSTRLVPPRSTRSTRSTRASSTIQEIEEDDHEDDLEDSEFDEVDTEITFKRPTRSARKGISLALKRVESDTTSGDDVIEDDDVTVDTLAESSIGSQPEFNLSESEEDDEIDDVENIPPGTSQKSVKDETAFLLGLDTSESEESVSPKKSVLRERVRMDTTVNHPKRVKKMMQPGKLKKPVDMEIQTVRRNGKIKSYLFENPDKRDKLVKYLKGQCDSFK